MEETMKFTAIQLACAMMLLSSCENKTETGALVGAGIGVAGGALIGKGEGALIGGAVGAVGGALIGSALDHQDRKKMEQESPKTLDKIDHGEKLTTNDVKEMSKAGLNDNVIIGQIQSTKSVFYLSTDDIIDLKNSGVSQRVIDYMIETGNTHH